MPKGLKACGIVNTKYNFICVNKEEGCSVNFIQFREESYTDDQNNLKYENRLNIDNNIHYDHIKLTRGFFITGNKFLHLILAKY